MRSRSRVLVVAVLLCCFSLHIPAQTKEQLSEIEPLVPFADKIIALEDARRRMEPIDSAKVAATLNDLRKQVDERRRSIELGLRSDTANGVKKTVANRAVQAINGLRTNLRN